MSATASELPAPRRRTGLAHSGLLRPLVAVGLALAVAGGLILVAGANPLLAYRAMALGAFGSVGRIASGLAKAAPYLACSVGVALCFRGRFINIGGEGQIAIGGATATWAALSLPTANPVLGIAAAVAAGMLGGAAWAGIAALLHLARGVNEVLVTLLMNFVALLLVSQLLEGSLGQAGAGFPQSPLLPRVVWLPRLLARTDLNIGVLLALAVAILAHILLWHTVWGFAIRTTGVSREAARYAGFSRAGTILLMMLTAGATAGLAGAIQVLGLHHRLIDGFSTGFGFVSVTVALLGGLDPLALIPAALFFGFLETGAAAMQRQVGVPSSLVAIIEGLTMLFVLAATGLRARRARA